MFGACSCFSALHRRQSVVELLHDSGERTAYRRFQRASIGCLDEYFDAFRKCDSNVTTTFELPHNHGYWHLCEIKEFRKRFGLEYTGIVSCCQIGLRWVRNLTNGGSGIGRFQQQTGDRCSSCQVCKMSLLGGARYIFRGELASNGILYQEVCNSLDS